MKLEDAVQVASAGMRVQSTRVQIASQNLANSDSLATTPGGEPYRRKTVSFREALDRDSGLHLVGIDRYGVDQGAFDKRHDPSHPAADAAGYVQLPNVEPLVELMDMREAQRSYEANLQAMSLTRTMVSQTLNLLK
ncbi:MAG: flagellar basal body rod protein FlgC [Alphaproteobacteria bacterium]|jgi:flagellar basal-body rod protein FlgC|nr:flagellar basal body rod protein FlgC [Alphaproteobacteria bacterium]